MVLLECSCACDMRASDPSMFFFAHMHACMFVQIDGLIRRLCDILCADRSGSLLSEALHIMSLIMTYELLCGSIATAVLTCSTYFLFIDPSLLS